jgi:hypothetical protein
VLTRITADESEWLWPILRYWLGCCLEQNSENIIHDRQKLSQVLSEYKSHDVLLFQCVKFSDVDRIELPQS